MSVAQAPSRLMSSAMWAIAGNGTQFSVVFLLTIYLAHVLAPRDFGLMATVAVGLDLGTRIARWGQVELLQQRRYGDDASRNQSLRFSLGLATLFAAVFALLALPMARYFAAPQLAWMMWLCAPVFLFSASGSVAEAVLRSNFQFNVLAFRSGVAALVGAAVAILLAQLGYGALTLAVQRLVQASLSGLWVWTAVDWRPRFGGRLDWSPALLREGGSVMFGTLLPVAVPRVIDLMVGLVMGPIVLGLMRIGLRISEFVGQMVVMPLVSVANAELSAKVHDKGQMRQSYLRLTQASAILMCPALIGLSLVAPEAVPLMFGSQWTPAVPFVEVTGLFALFAPINYYFAPAMVALGQSRSVLRQGLWQILLGALLTVAAAQISLLAIAWSHVLRGAIVGLLNMLELRRHMDLPLRQLARSMAVPYLASLTMALAVTGSRLLLFEGAEWHVRLALLILIGGASYGLALHLLALFGMWPDYRLIAARLLPVRRRGR